MTDVDLTNTKAEAERVAAEWGLELGAPFTLSRYSYVAPVGDDAVLKVPWEGDDESLHEGDALELWAGDGAVHLLRRGGRALLEERALPGVDISEVPEEEGTAILVDSDFLVARFNPDGSIDRSWAKIRTDVTDTLLNHGILANLRFVTPFPTQGGTDARINMGNFALRPNGRIVTSI